MNIRRHILFLSYRIPEKSGAANFTRTVLEALQGNPSFRIVCRTIDPLSSVIEKLGAYAQGYICGVTKHLAEEIISQIEREKIDCIFVNFTFWGRLLSVIKRRFPTIRICTLAHDCEVDLMYDRMVSTRRWRLLLGLFFTFLNERRQARLTDVLVCLNRRDALAYEKRYGRTADCLLPIMLKDRLAEAKGKLDASPCDRYGLFVGSRGLEPNAHGMRWFARYVAPHIGMRIKVVGAAFEDLRSELEAYPNLEVVGTVDDLGGWYVNAEFVISPIFRGAGMKTKTAEALMYGKYIIATDEAWEGYEAIPFPECGARCNTAEEFIAAIGAIERNGMPRFVSSSRRYYENRYSYAQMVANMDRVLELTLGDAG